MKKLFFILSLLFIPLLSLAQYPKVYGHNSFDMIGRSIQCSNDGGVIITGAERLSPLGDLIGYMIKTDINGNELWKRYFTQGDNISTNVLGFSVNLNDEIVLSGAIMNSNNIGISNGFVLKLDPCGEKLWCKIIDIPGQNLCFNNVVLPDNGYIVHANHNQFSFDRIWLYRLDAEGNLLWQKCMDPDTNYFDETGYKLLLTNDSCVLVTGFNYYIREPGSGLGWFSPLWVKFDLDGNQLWGLTWYGDGFIHGNFGQTIQDARGNYYGAGNDGNMDQPNTSCFFKFSANGVPLKKATVWNTVTSTTKSIAFFADSTLFMGGGSGNTLGAGYDNYFVLKCDTMGNVIKSKYLPLDGSDGSLAVVSSDNKIYTLNERIVNNGIGHWETCLFKFNQNLEYDSTYTVPRTYDSLCPYAVTPTATINLDCVTVNTEEPIKKPEGSMLKVYPLPATGIVTIALPEYYIMEENKFHIKTTTTYFQLKGAKSIEIVNLNGQKTATFNLADGETSIDFDVSNWAPGMYLARLVCKGKVWAQGKVMVVR